MPPPRAEGGAAPRRIPSGSTRRDPLILIAVALVLLALRVALHWQENRAQQPAAPGSATATDHVRWRALAAGVEEAGATGKPLLFDFTADWCPPCRLMQREIFADPAAAADLERRFVPIRVLDRAREDGHNEAWVDSLQRRYRVGVFPTLVVAGPDGRNEVRIEGYLGRDFVLDRIASARDQVRAHAVMPPLTR